MQPANIKVEPLQPDLEKVSQGPQNATQNSLQQDSSSMQQEKAEDAKRQQKRLEEERAKQANKHFYFKIAGRLPGEEVILDGWRLVTFGDIQRPIKNGSSDFLGQIFFHRAAKAFGAQYEQVENGVRIFYENTLQNSQAQVI